MLALDPSGHRRLSPIGDRAVMMAPLDRRRLLKRMLLGRLEIDLDADAGSEARLDVAALDRRHAGDDRVTPRHVGTHHFLNEEVRHREAEVDIDHGRNRPQRIVGRHADAERIAERGDAPDLGQAAGMADVRLGDRDRLRLQERQELAPMGEPFARGDRDRGRARDTRNAVGIVGLAGLFEKERAKRLEHLCVLDRHRGARSPMQIDHDVHVVAGAGARRRHQPLGVLERREAVERRSLADSQDLDRREPVGARARCSLGERFSRRVVIDRGRIAAAEMVVHAQPIAREPAEQLP